ncbi:hypothetical protein GX48_08106 [Paracoccidioides brasiliensis]|nr:hypothetical protein GX48_08106 [Paracoccidioides brasiliensis]
MSDIDAEILALAGGDDSSDEETAPAQPKGASPKSHGSGSNRNNSGSSSNNNNSNNSSSNNNNSNNNNSNSHNNDGGESEEESGEVSRKKTGNSSSSRRKRSRNAADDDDAELSSSSSRSRTSLRSAAMSESSSSASPPPDPDSQGPIFPYEKLFHSAKDKAEVMALPEIQREQLLSDRAQQVDRHNQDLALRRLLASREREEARAAEKMMKKRKVGATDLEEKESQRKSSRQKMTLGGRKVGETSDAIEAYKKRREMKEKRDEMRRREAGQRKRGARDSSGSPEDGLVSDNDDAVAAAAAGGHSEVEWDDGVGGEGGARRRSSSLPKDDPPAELRDIQRVKVGRSNFAQVCFYPGFDQAIADCFVRVVVGVKKDGENEYRVCSIKRFVEGRPYAMEAANGRNFVTTQYAVLAHGKSEREFPFIACSDSPITEPEFNRYRQTMIVEGCKMPTKSQTAAKVTAINRLINHPFTREELEEKLRRQGTNDNKTKIFQRIQLERRRQEALTSGDEAAIAQCDAELAQFVGPKLAFGTVLCKPRSKEKTQQERLQELNLRNQKLNAESVRRAEIEERRRVRLEAERVARGEAIKDRFARVKTRARIHYDVHGDRLVPKGAGAGVRNGSGNGKGEEEGGFVSEGSGISGAVTPITGANTPMAASAGVSNGNGNVTKAGTLNGSGAGGATPGNGGSGNKQRKGIPVIRHRPTDDENIAALDLGIDIEI